MKKISKFDYAFITLFGIGSSPASGTVASFVALIIGGFIALFNPTTLLLLSVLIFILALPKISAYQKINPQNHDPKEIVVDELVGMWFCIVICASFEGTLSHKLALFVFGFVFFRILDIFKPSVIGRIDKGMKNAFGVMLDDILSGVFAGFLALFVLRIYDFWK
ncbi:MAG: phosphatidylglycerophosphatase A [Helicobacter sp.]|nr:phosphatidylglycerophosphatase A [Helicobacter sp.]